MLLFTITFFIVLLSLICVAFMVYKLIRQPKVFLKPWDFLKLSVSGILAFIADTLGIGSFAVNVALAKFFNTFPDEQLPAVNNGAQLIPGVIEALFFIHLIDVDKTTFISLVGATCLGGLVGAVLVSHISRQAIRLAMIICFTGIIFLLIGNKMHWLPLTGTDLALHSWKLALGCLAFLLCGAITSVGVGLFAMVQAVLFLLNISPVIAFPIMMAAGAMQQPLTTLVFLQQDKIPIKKTLIISLSGCLGVLITLPLVIRLNTQWLYSLLLMILVYNLWSIGKAYWYELNSASRTTKALLSHSR